MPTERQQIAADALALADDPSALYLELIGWNGTIQNMILRRLSDGQLDALIEYATQQPPLPHSSVNYIQGIAQEVRRQRSG